MRGDGDGEVTRLFWSPESGVVARLGDRRWQDFACGMNARLESSSLTAESGVWRSACKVFNHSLAFFESSIEN